MLFEALISPDRRGYVGLDDILLLSYPCGESWPVGYRVRGLAAAAAADRRALAQLTPGLHFGSKGPAFLPPGRRGGQRGPERLLPVYGGGQGSGGRAFPSAGERGWAGGEGDLGQLLKKSSSSLAEC